VNLRPLGDRILIKPEKPAEQTESGLWLSEHPKPEEAGTVVAVGSCTHPLKHEAEEVARELEWRINSQPNCPTTEDWIEKLQELPDMRAAKLLRQATSREPSVKVGDYVIFSWTAGQRIQIDDSDEVYLMLRESDVLAVVEGIQA
jgi:co-chaperonin GroES (HSP10)